MFAQSVLAESNSLYVGDMVFYIISFIILMLLVKKFAWKPVVKMMHDRAEKSLMILIVLSNHATKQVI